MKTHLIAFLVIALSALGASAQADKRFVSKEHHFSVVLPDGFDKFGLMSSRGKADSDKSNSASYGQTVRRQSVAIAISD